MKKLILLILLVTPMIVPTSISRKAVDDLYQAIETKDVNTARDLLQTHGNQIVEQEMIDMTATYGGDTRGGPVYLDYQGNQISQQDSFKLYEIRKLFEQYQS